MPTLGSAAGLRGTECNSLVKQTGLLALSNSEC
jgi:hypothetical protein